jgi:hypothetical protein
LVIRHENDATLLCQYDDCFPQRAARRQDRQRIHQHDLVDTCHETTTKRPSRMQARKVLATKSLVLEQRHRERIA